MDSRQASYIKDADIMLRGLLPAQQRSQILKQSRQRTKGCKERKKKRGQRGPLSSFPETRKYHRETVFLSVLTICNHRAVPWVCSVSPGDECSPRAKDMYFDALFRDGTSSISCKICMCGATNRI